MSKNKKPKYEVFDYIPDNYDSIRAPEFEDRPGGQIYINENSIKDLVKDELAKLLGPAIKRYFEDDY